MCMHVGLALVVMLSVHTECLQLNHPASVNVITLLMIKYVYLTETILLVAFNGSLDKALPIL